jgi:hypothetical protein
MQDLLTMINIIASDCAPNNYTSCRNTLCFDFQNVIFVQQIEVVRLSYIDDFANMNTL